MREEVLKIELTTRTTSDKPTFQDQSTTLNVGPLQIHKKEPLNQDRYQKPFTSSPFFSNESIAAASSPAII